MAARETPMDGRALLALIQGMEESERAELWNSIRGRALREIDDYTKTRILAGGQPVTTLDGGTRVGFETESYADILNFIGAPVAINSRTNGRQFDINVGGGPCYDYIVDINGGGDFTSISGALSAIKALADNNKSYTIFVCPGDYVETTTPDWPTTNQAQAVSITAGGDAGLSSSVSGVLWRASGAGGVVVTLNIVTNPCDMSLSNFTMGLGNSAVQAIKTASGINLSANFHKMYFSGSIDADFGNAVFVQCIFGQNGNGGLVLGSSVAPQYIALIGCYIAGPIDFRSAVSIREVVINGCRFITNSGSAIYLGDSAYTVIANNTFAGNGSSYGTPTIIFDTSTGIVSNLVIANNAFQRPPSSGAATIEFSNVNTAYNMSGTITITGNTWGSWGTLPTLSATTCFVRFAGSALDYYQNVHISGNAFAGFLTQPLGSIETSGGYSVIGAYMRHSVFGPNAPATLVRYNITNGTNNEFYPATASSVPGTGTGGDASNAEPYVVYAAAPALTAARQYINVAAGVPAAATRPEGAFYWNTETDSLYVNKDSGTAWGPPMKFRVYTSLGESAAGVVNSFP
jgi:parallel beta-helix repeat protein